MASFDEKQYETTIVPELLALQRRHRIADAFLRYGLDLEEDDTPRIEARMTGVHAYWARKSTHSRDGLLYKTLQADSTTQDTLRDPARRATLRATLKEERASAERESVRHLDEEIALAAAEGYLTPRGAAALLKRLLDQGYDDNVVREHMSGVTVQETEIIPPLPEGLKGTVMSNVDNALTVLGFTDLYTYLGLPTDAPAHMWTARYAEVAENARRKKRGPRTEAENVLLGIVKSSLLADPTLYSKARILQLALAMEPKVLQVGIEGSIGERGLDGLRKAALELGIASQSVGGVLSWLAQKNKIALPSKGQAVPVSLCPRCRRVIYSAGKQETCPHCTFSLWTRCSECSCKTMTGAPCTSCGYPLQRDADLKSLLQQGERKLQAKDVPRAIALLDQMETLWLHGAVANFRHRLEAVRDEIESVCRDFRAAMAKHECLRAGHLLGTLRPAGAEYVFHDGATLASLQRELDGVLKPLEAILASARTSLADRQWDQAVSFFERALAIASDSVEARKGLSSCPLAPASGLAVRVNTASVTLTWLPSSSKGSVEYVVAWRSDRVPRDGGDGEGARTASPGKLAWDDTTVPAGTVRFYAIFTKRGDSFSVPIASEAVLAAFEVTNLKAIARRNQIDGSWDALPAGTRAITIRRTVGTPGAGDSVPCGPSGFTDTSTDLSGRYEYCVAVEYRTASGVKRTAGLTVLAQAEKRLEPATNLRVMHQGPSQRAVSWKPPANGGVEIFGFAVLLYRIGEIVERARWTDMAQQHLKLVGNPALWTRDTSEPLFVTAVTFLNELALIGPSVFDGDDVSNLTGNELQTALELFWTWPAGATAAQVCWRFDHYAESPCEPGNQSHLVTLGQYSVARRFLLEKSQARKYFVTVFAGYPMADGSAAYAPGTSRGCQMVLGGPTRTSIYFEVAKPKFSFGRKFRLDIRCGEPGTVLPELKLVFKRGGPSVLNLMDGQVVETFSGRSSPVEFFFDLPLKGFVGLFLAEEADTHKYRVVAPVISQLDRTQ